MSEISFTFISFLVFILSLAEPFCLFSYFLCFWFWIYASEAKSLMGSLNHLLLFSCNNLIVQGVY
jgi:hypothetical protein